MVDGCCETKIEGDFCLIGFMSGSWDGCVSKIQQQGDLTLAFAIDENTAKNGTAEYCGIHVLCNKMQGSRVRVSTAECICSFAACAINNFQQIVSDERRSSATCTCTGNRRSFRLSSLPGSRTVVIGTSSEYVV